MFLIRLTTAHIIPVHMIPRRQKDPDRIAFSFSFLHQRRLKLYRSSLLGLGRKSLTWRSQWSNNLVPSSKQTWTYENNEKSVERSQFGYFQGYVDHISGRKVTYGKPIVAIFNTIIQFQFNEIQFQFNEIQVQFNEIRIQFNEIQIQFNEIQIQFNEIQIQFNEIQVQFNKNSISIQWKFKFNSMKFRFNSSSIQVQSQGTHTICLRNRL